MSLFGMRASQMVDPSRALRGRSETMPVPERHTVLGTPLAPPYPAGTEIAEFALGCFWGEERKFWETPGVVSTSVGYEGGYTPNPTYEEVCSGRTGTRGDRPRRLRSCPGLLRDAAHGVLGVTRPDAGHAPGQRRRHPVPFGDLLPLTGAAGRGRAVPRGLPEAADRARLRRRSPRRSSRRRSSTSPRTTTSSTWPRTRSATAASAAPAWPARSGSSAPAAELWSPGQRVRRGRRSRRPDY